VILIIHLIVDIRTIDEKRSGIGQYTESYIRNLLYRYPNDFSIIGITDKKNKLVESLIKDLGIEVIEYGKKVFRSITIFKYFSFVKSEILKRNPDIFWEPNNIFPHSLKNKNTKLLVTIHDIFPITFPSSYSFKYRFYFKHAVRKTINNADKIITVSQKTKYDIEKVFGNKKISVIYNIINFEPNFMSISDEIYQDDFFLFLGNFEYRKGVYLLLPAYEQYLENGGKNSLFIAGNINREKKARFFLNKFIEKYPNKIKIFGYIDEKVKWQLLNSKRCIAFVFPSLAEGFGTPPLEALFSGRKVIVSNIPIFKEILEDFPIYFEIENDVMNSIKNLSKALFKSETLNKSPNNFFEYLNNKFSTEKLIDEFATELKKEW